MNMSHLCVSFGNYSAFSAQQLLLAWLLEPYLCMCKPDMGKKSREPQYKSLELLFWVFLALSSTPYQVWQPQPTELQSLLLSSTRWLHYPRVLLCWRCLGRKSSAHGAHPLLLYSEGSLSVPSDVQFLSCRQQKDKLVPGILHDQEQKSYFARGSQVRKHPVPTLMRSSQEFWVPLGEGGTSRRSFFGLGAVTLPHNPTWAWLLTCQQSQPCSWVWGGTMVHNHPYCEAGQVLFVMGILGRRVNWRPPWAL